MKNIATAIFLIALVSAAAVPAGAADAPHNASLTIACADCHPQGTATAVTDDVCLGCHTNTSGGGYTRNSAPRMQTHANSGAASKYGEWSASCSACHGHTQDQRAAYGAATYLVTGTISAVTDTGNGTTTFGYINPVEVAPGWGDPAKWGRKSSGNAAGGNERGLIFFPNTSDPDVSFEVISATVNEITVQGSVNAAFAGRAAEGNSFALSYGQQVNAGITGADGTAGEVKFFQNSSSNSFAVNDAAPGSPDTVANGVCQVCHTRTSFWRADGSGTDHYSGANCTACHRHEAGFRTTCDICHSAPPAAGAHNTHFAAGQPVYGTTSLQSTTAAYAYSCGVCHQGLHLNTTGNPRTAEVAFGGIAKQNLASTAAYAPSAFSTDDPGTGYTFNYSNGQCSNTYCHGNYPGSGRNAAPTWSGTAACGSCHGASNTDIPSSGSHQLHVNPSYGSNGACSVCHAGIVSGTGPNSYSIADRSRHANGVVDWQFDSGNPVMSPSASYSLPSGTLPPTDGTRLGGTCTNVYCHSIAQTATGGPLTGAPGEYMTTPRWGAQSSGLYFCGGCHKNGSHHNNGSPAPMDSGSHPKHLEYNFNTVTNQGTRSYRCAICHRYEAQSFGSYNGCEACHSTDALAAGHADGKIEVKIDTYFGSVTYNDNTAAPGAPGNGFFSCSNTYCHSDGTAVATGAIPANTSAVWGSGAQGCNACHGNPPSYPNGTPKKNSHPAHAGEPCSKCHGSTTTNGTTIASTAFHVNRAYDVTPDAASGVTFTYAFAIGGGSCSAISCHGGNSAAWGASIACQDCHAGAADFDDFAGVFYNNGITSNIRGAGEWDTTGHGRAATAGNYASGNPAADLTAPHACLYCHDGAVTHKTGANPFRLRSQDDPAWGRNGVCQNCHGDGSAGITIDALLRNGSKKIGSTHYGSKHGAAGNGGQFCWDCHDPHGDGNLFMVQSAVAKISDINSGAPVSTMTTSFVTFATGSGYASSAEPFTGVCNVCHTTTNHYTASSGDGHNAETRCTQCHSHTRDTRENAFQAACDACHGNPPLDDTSLAGFVSPSRTGSVTAGAHSKHVKELKIRCDNCHANSAGSGSTHANGDLTVTLGFSLFDGLYTTGAYSGQSTVSYNASLPTTTVSSSGLKECSNIYCHGSSMAPNGGSDISPVWDNPATVACGSCHGASTASPPTRGAHSRHAGPYTDVGHEYACSSCHTDPSVDASLHVNNRSEVSFSTHPTVSGGSYTGTPGMLDAYGSCSNVYCHSNVQTSPPGGPLTYKSINWGTSYGGDMGCSACHEGPLDHYTEPLDGNRSGSHPKHAAGGIYCATCHANDVNEDPDPATQGWACFTCHTSNGPNVTHGNYAVDVNIVTKYGGSYSGTPQPGDAYGNCSATYCHGDGTSVRTGVISSASVTWGSGSLGCNSCHGNAVYAAPNNAMPDYPNGSPKENSHAAHVTANGIGCQICHAGTTGDGLSIANRALHLNKQYDASASGTFNGAAVSFVYSAPAGSQPGSCSAISCHGGNSAPWGAALACQDCHAAAADADNFSTGFWSDGTAGRIGSAEWSSTGHGRPAAAGAYASGNAAAAFSTATGTNTTDRGCQFCHEPSAAHKDSANPFRLRNTADPAWGMNGACQICHAEGSAGVTVDGVLRNGSKKIGPAHYGTKHTATADGGQFCWDCHDGHGDGNAYMVHAAVAKTSDPATGAPTSQVATVFNLSSPATGADYAKSSAPFDGLCNVCHTTASHYTATSGDGHNASIRCTQCHQHTDGFKPGGDNCSDCHSSAGGATPGTAPDAYHAKHVRTAYAGKISLGDYGNYTTNQWYRYSNVGGTPDMGCGYCHPQASGTHMNGTVNLNFDRNDAGAAGTVKSKNSGTQAYTQNTRVSVTCSSVYCHSDGYLNGASYGYRISPDWYGGAYPGDKCSGCHGNSPTGSPAHAKHVVGIHYQNIFTGTSGTATAGNTDTSSHGYADAAGTELTATTINCNVCHYDTVTTAANDGNPVCAACHGANPKGSVVIASGSMNHVNGSVDIAFTPAPVRSRAQVRDSIANTAELNNNWTRMNGYKAAGSYDLAKSAPTYTAGNCTVACHNGNPVTWTSTVTCSSCHSDLP